MGIQRWSPTIWIAELGDEPNLDDDLLLVRDEVAASSQTPDLVLDLTGIGQINSSQLSKLLQIRKQAIDSDARLRLVAPCDAVWAVFLMTGLDKVFQFEADRPTALAALQMDG